MMDSIRSILGDWGTYIVLTALQFILSTCVATAYTIVAGYLDRNLPDNLPLTAGQWLRERIDERGLTGRLKVAVHDEDSSTDAYLPTASMILLSRKTYFKNDPSFWAIAGHELGHALVHGVWAPLGWFFQTSRLAAKGVAVLGAGAIMANALYASPLIARAAASLVLAGVVLNVPVLLDEMLASVLGLRMLAADDRVSRVGLAGACVALLAAFFTYLGAFAGQILLLLETGVLTNIILHRRHFAPDPPLAGFGLIVVAALSLATIAAITRSLVMLWRRPTHQSLSDASKYKSKTFWIQLAFDLIFLALLYQVWALPKGFAFQLAAVVALLCARRGYGLLLMPLLFVAIVPLVLAFLPFFFLMGFLVKRFGQGEDSNAVRAAERSGKFEIKQGAQDIEAAALLYENNPHWGTRLGEYLFQLGRLPLLWLLWLG